MENELRSHYRFVDVLVVRDQEQGEIRTTVYKKPTHTEHCDSYHLPHVKSGIIRTLVHKSEVISHDSDIHS